MGKTHISPSLGRPSEPLLQIRLVRVHKPYSFAKFLSVDKLVRNGLAENGERLTRFMSVEHSELLHGLWIVSNTLMTTSLLGNPSKHHQIFLIANGVPQLLRKLRGSSPKRR